MSSWFGFSLSSSSSNKASPASPQKESTIDDPLERSHPAYRRRADEGAVFTASKCPPGPGLKNSCELPFGFVWSPMAIYNRTLEECEEDSSGKRQPMPVIQCIDSQSLPPVLCLACLAYINPFAKMDYNTGVWICPLCEQENVAPQDQLQEGSNVATALKYSCVEYRLPPPTTEGSHNGSDDDFCSYILVVDENLDPQDGRAIAPAVESLLRQQVAKSEQFPKIRIGLIVFGKSVWTYHLGILGVTSADLYVAADQASEESVNEILEMDKRAYLKLVGLDDSLITLKNAIASVFDASIDDNLSDNENSETSVCFSPRMAKLAKQKENRLRKEQGENEETEVPTESPWVRRRRESKLGHPTRCTGEAVQCALDLASANICNPSRTSRIILFTNGCPNSGDGSVIAAESVDDKHNVKKIGQHPVHDVVDVNMLQKSVDYFDMTGKIAVSNGIGFDVFCSGATELALPAYQALVEPSCGYVIPLLTFETEQMERNLEFLLENTYMSRSRYVPEEMQDDEAGAECILDIRTDGFISPTQLCGSGEILPDHASRLMENERSSFAAGSALAAGHGITTKNLPSIEAIERSMTRVQVGRIDPLTTFAVMLEVDDR
jgi:hypothetical protein